MGEFTIKDSLVSFESPAVTDVTSAKVYFKPVQEGSGDPSPENIRPISGWDGWLFNAHGQNFWNNEDYAKASWYPRTDEYSDYYTGTLQHMRDINGGYGLFDEFMPLGRVNVSFDRLNAGSNIRIYYHYTDSTAWDNHSGNNSTAGHKSWTSDAGRVCNGAKIYTTAGVSAAGSFGNMQITISDSELPYEPFKGIRKRIVPYEIAGKNLFSVGGCSKYFYTNASGEMAINTNSMCSDYIPVSPNTEYVFSGINKYSGNTAVRIHAYDSNKNWIEQISYISGIASGNSFELPLVTPGNAAYIRTSSAMPLGNAQFELGSTATAYESFKTIYGGYIDVVNGVLVEEWSQIASYNGETLPGEWISDRDAYTAGTSPTIGAQVAYELSAPITYQLTPQTLQTIKGINNFWSNSNADIEITYKVADALKMTQIRKNILMSQPHVESATAANPLTFQTDIPANLKDCKIYFEPVQDLHGYDKPYPAGSGKNLWGGLAMANDIASATGVTVDTNNKTVNITIGGAEAVLTSGIEFKENTQYTFILDGTYFTHANLMFVYTDGTNDRGLGRYMDAGATVSAPGKTIQSIVKRSYSNTTIINYETSGLFEGVKTANDYEPYENICPITGWDGVEITRCGKNLIKPMSDTDFWGNGYITSVETIVSTNSYAYTKVPLKVQAGTYIISSSNSYVWKGIYASDMRGNKLGFKESTATSVYLTVSEDALLSVYVQRTATNVQLECNSEPTAYEPYTGTSLTIPFPQTIYGGYVDLVKGEVVETDYLLAVDENTSIYRLRKNAGKRVVADYRLPYTGKKGKFLYYSHGTVVDAYSSTYNYQLAGTVANEPYNSNTVYAMVAPPSDITETEQYADWIESVAPLQIAYKLATPITHQLTDGLNHITLGQDISPRPNGRSSTGGYANSTATGIDGCKFVYFELGWPTEEFLQYSADISRKSEFVSDSRVLINGTTTDAKLGEMVLSTGSATDYEGDTLVYLYVSVPSGYTDLESKRAYLAEHPIKITYPKKTPIPYTVDLTDLKPVKGTNNIWSNTNNNIEVKFWKH